MRVLQIGDVAGIPFELRRIIKKNGQICKVLTFCDLHKFKYSIPDYEYNLSFLRRFKNKILLRFLKDFSKTFFLFRIVKNFDILHFHGGTTIKFGLDIVLWKILGKKVFLHYHGSDIRGKKFYNLFLFLSNRCFVSTPDLLKFCKKAIWIPNPINLEKFKNFSKKKKLNSTITIVHAPSKRKIKGTKYILQAIKKLKLEGEVFNFRLVENLTHAEALKVYSDADIILDQLIIGWYGLFSVEGMALKKCICVYIREDLKSFIPNSPLINVNKANLYFTLKELLKDSKRISESGEKGFDFVVQRHDSEKIAQEIISYYKGGGV
jgi:glycosyltransferase involved in cell wall biosynthesis